MVHSGITLERKGVVKGHHVVLWYQTGLLERFGRVRVGLL